MNQIYKTTTSKSPSQFAGDLEKSATPFGFTIHNHATIDMAAHFKKHGQEVRDDFDLHMIQICKPDKASQSLQANPERSVLMPKFVMAFSEGGKTQVRFLSFGRQEIESLVNDSAFADSLAQSYQKITEIIEQAI